MRSRAKSVARTEYLEQIELDKLNGLENGKVCRESYRRLCQKPNLAANASRRSKRYKPMRTADTYRGAARNAERGPRNSLVLKALRKASGETRTDMDRRRMQEAV